MKLLGTDTIYEPQPPEVLRPCPSVILHQYQVRKARRLHAVWFLHTLTLQTTRLQLLHISEDGFATLLDGDSTITEDTLIEPNWRELLQQMLATGTGSPTSHQESTGTNPHHQILVACRRGGLVVLPSCAWILAALVCCTWEQPGRLHSPRGLIFITRFCTSPVMKSVRHSSFRC
jgi:hypothetical protein